MIKKLFIVFAAIVLSANSFAQYCEAPGTTLHSVDCTASGNGTIDEVSILSTPLSNVGSGCNGGVTAFTLFTGQANYTATLTKGQTYSLVVTGGLTNQDISVWIDYNINQTFEASEWQQVALNSAIGVQNTISVTIPTTAATGITRMRIRSRNTGFSNGSGDACTVFGSGETEDYLVTLTGGSSGPCIASSQYPSATITGPTVNGTTVNITTAADCNYSGEYSVVSLTAGNYTVTSSTSTDYFTVTTTASSVVASGNQPLSFNVAAGTYHIHVFQDNLCTVANICRAVAITRNGSASTPPSVTTSTTSAITANGANSGGTVTSAGSATVTSRGVCYSTIANPTIADPIVTSGSGTGAFTAAISGLTPSTTYHVRAFATSSVGTSYGTDVTFTTTAPAGCISTTQYPSSTITGPATNGASVVITPPTGTCNYAGEYAVLTLGIGNYTVTSSTTTDYLTLTNNLGTVITSSVQPLTFSIATAGTYWVHVHKDALCTTESVCRGLTIVKNSSSVLPTVTTTPASAITAGGATTGGNVSQAGSSTVTARGVCYATYCQPDYGKFNRCEWFRNRIIYC